MSSSERAPQVQQWRNKNIRKRVRLIPLLVAAMLSFVLSMYFLGLLWSAVAFLTYENVAEAVFMPLLIYYLALLVACLLVSFLSRGLRFSPAVITALLASIFSVYLTGFNNINWNMLLLKTGIGIIIAIITVIIAVAVFSKKNRRFREIDSSAKHYQHSRQRGLAHNTAREDNTGN